MRFAHFDQEENKGQITHVEMEEQTQHDQPLLENQIQADSDAVLQLILCANDFSVVLCKALVVEVETNSCVVPFLFGRNLSCWFLCELIMSVFFYSNPLHALSCLENKAKHCVNACLNPAEYIYIYISYVYPFLNKSC